MKSKIFLRSFCFISLSCTSISNNLNIYSTSVNPNNKFSYLKESISSWNDSNCYLDFSFTYENSKFYLYSLTKNDDYKGYFITDNSYNVKTMYVGNVKASNENIESLSPIFSNNVEIIDESNNIDTNAISLASSYYEPPTLNADLYTSYSGSFGNEQKITDCPTYFNPTSYMCIPTACAMLLSFLDRYSNLNNLYSGLLPLDHDDNKTLVDNFIKNLANKYLGTTSKGTKLNNETIGLDKYLKEKGYGNYGAYFIYSFDRYSEFINKFEQPVIVSITLEGKPQDQGHSVLGIGAATVRYSGRFIVCHYGERSTGLGDYYVSSDYFYNFTYIGKDS